MKKSKRGKKPNRLQRGVLTAEGLRWENWLVVSTDMESITVRNKNSGKTRVIRC